MRADVRYLVERAGRTGASARVVEPWHGPREQALLTAGRIIEVSEANGQPYEITYALPEPPTIGFDFGTSGAGAAALALAILRDLFGEREGQLASRARLHHQALCDDYLIRSVPSFELDGNQMLWWVIDREQPCDVCHGSGEVPTDDPQEYAFGLLTQICGACGSLGVQCREVKP